MDINATLIGEMLTFFVLIFVMIKYIWPKLIQAINERQQQIISGLDAAKRSKHELEITKNVIGQQLKETKVQIDLLIKRANEQAKFIVDQGKIDAIKEKEIILSKAKSDLNSEITRAKNDLKEYITLLTVSMTEKVIQQHFNTKMQQKLIMQLNTKIEDIIKDHQEE